jgi:hypothetical protein
MKTKKMTTYNKIRNTLAELDQLKMIQFRTNAIRTLKILNKYIDTNASNRAKSHSVLMIKLWESSIKKFSRLPPEAKEKYLCSADDILLETNQIRMCPIHQCGGMLTTKIRKAPKGDNIDGYYGDEQSPDLVCTNCKAVYEFKGFKHGKNNL